MLEVSLVPVAFAMYEAVSILPTANVRATSEDHSRESEGRKRRTVQPRVAPESAFANSESLRSVSEDKEQFSDAARSFVPTGKPLK